MSKPQIQFTIVTVLGDVHRSHWTDRPDEDDLEEVVDVLKNFKNLDHLSLETDMGQMMFFNPSHVVSFTIEERE